MLAEVLPLIPLDGSVHSSIAKVDLLTQVFPRPEKTPESRNQSTDLTFSNHSNLPLYHFPSFPNLKNTSVFQTHPHARISAPLERSTEDIITFSLIHLELMTTRDDGPGRVFQTPSAVSVYRSVDVGSPGGGEEVCSERVPPPPLEN